MSAFECLVRRKLEFSANPRVFLLAGGPEAVGGELDLAALVGDVFDQFFQGLARRGGAGLFAALLGLDALVGFESVFEGLQFRRFDARQAGVSSPGEHVRAAVFEGGSAHAFHVLPVVIVVEGRLVFREVFLFGGGLDILDLGEQGVAPGLLFLSDDFLAGRLAGGLAGQQAGFLEVGIEFSEEGLVNLALGQGGRVPGLGGDDCEFLGGGDFVQPGLVDFGAFAGRFLFRGLWRSWSGWVWCWFWLNFLVFPAAFLLDGEQVAKEKVENGLTGVWLNTGGGGQRSEARGPNRHRNCCGSGQPRSEV